MAYELPFPIPPEQVIASYDYTDIAAGTGINRFYAGICKNGTTTSYFLSQNVTYGYPQETTATSSEFALSAFNTPRTIQGTALVDFSLTGTTAVARFLLVKYVVPKDVTTTATLTPAATDGGATTVTYTATSLATNVFLSSTVVDTNSNDAATITIKDSTGAIVATQTQNPGTASKTFTLTEANYADFFDTGEVMTVVITSVGTIKSTSAQTLTSSLADTTNQTVNNAGITFIQVKNYEVIAKTKGSVAVSADTSMMMKLEVPQTHFKIGEKLILRAGITGTGTLALACDPANRDSTNFVAATNHTSLNLYLPFKLDI